MRLAALDLGSNSFHLLVVETRPDGSFVPLVREKEMLGLGDLVAQGGSLPPEAIARATEVVGRFRTLAEKEGASELVAYGTSALREASNGAAAVEHLEQATGVHVKVITGLREAQLIFEAVRASVLIEPGPALSADLGGGSLELGIGDRSGLFYATSLHLGVGRLVTELVGSDPASAQSLGRLRRRVAEQLAPVSDEVEESAPCQLIVSSGTFVALVRSAAALRDGVMPEAINQLTVGGKELSELSELVFSLPAEARARLPGVDIRRAEMLPAGMVVLEALLEMSGLSEVTASGWALREGIVLSAISHHDKADLGTDPRAIRRASVLSLCRRSSWREAHAREVAALSVGLFDATASLHRLSSEDRELLELGGLLHDIGGHVSRDDHGRHTAYLVENGGLRGFSPDEVRMLAVLGRFHTRGRPRVSFAAYRLLSSQERLRCVKLLSILRIADGLDVSHGSVVTSVDAAVSSAGVEVIAQVKGDAEIERWIFGRKKALFEQVFATGVVLRCEASGHDEIEARLAGGSGLG
ncbi:MAG: HD domain-containing protein [Acidimicrobiales bacterium]